jgi:hypothetical protein
MHSQNQLTSRIQQVSNISETIARSLARIGTPPNIYELQTANA